MGTAKYESSLRREQADQTRERILRTARRVFDARGYAATTVAALADEAGVSQPTIYRVFGSKRGILMALLDAMSAEAGRADVRALLDASDGDPHEQLRIEVDHIVGIFERWIDFAQVVLAVAASDRGVAAVGQEGDRRRRARQDRIVRAWHQQGVLRTSLSVQHATDVLWAMTGPEMFALMTRTAGWSVPQFRTWLARMLSRELLRD